MSRSILLTGGAGYIGSHANKLLTERGYRTVVLDNLVRGHKDMVRWGQFVQGDVGSAELLKELFQKYQFGAVLHFAAYAYVDESVRDPGKYWRNNVAASLTLIENCIESGVEKFVFSSTCTTYGNPETTPISEDHKQDPVNPYGSSKLAVEQILNDCANAYNFRYVNLRYFNAAGADPDSEIGERHLPQTRLIPSTLDVALGKRECINIFGNDYPTEDGTCVRDYVHVTDLAEVHFRALQFLENGYPSRSFNVGNGVGFSVKNVIDSARKITGCNIPIKNEPRRIGDPPILVAKAHLAKSVLGWEPVYKDLDGMIRTAWNWHRKAYRD